MGEGVEGEEIEEEGNEGEGWSKWGFGGGGGVRRARSVGMGGQKRRYLSLTLSKVICICLTRALV